MSLALYVVLSAGLEDVVDASMEGKALAHQADQLAKLAKSRGVPDLWSFHSESADDVAAFLESDGLEADALETPALPAEKWFEPEAGLTTVRALLSGLEDEPSTVDDVDDVIEDLKQIERILVAAESRDGKFHLSVDF